MNFTERLVYLAHCLSGTYRFLYFVIEFLCDFRATQLERKTDYITIFIIHWLMCVREIKIVKIINVKFNYKMYENICIFRVFIS